MTIDHKNISAGYAGYGPHPISGEASPPEGGSGLMPRGGEGAGEVGVVEDREHSLWLTREVARLAAENKRLREESRAELIKKTELVLTKEATAEALRHPMSLAGYPTEPDETCPECGHDL